MINREIQDKLTKLTRILNTLSIKQQETNREIKKTRKSAVELTETIKDLDGEEEYSQEEVIKGSNLYISDHAVIQNPSKGQEDRGEIVSKTRDGLVKVKTSTTKIISRLPKNPIE